MGVREALSRLLRRKSQEEMIESALTSASEALQERFGALESAEITKEKSIPELDTVPPKLSPPMELQKESLQLGVVAGYTGKSLREIESSLNRIESQIVTKDWFSTQFEDRTPELIRLLENHDKNLEKRFEAIQQSLMSIKRIAEVSPEPLKTKLNYEIHTIESKLPLTPRMKEILRIIEETKEISYYDLATRLKIGVSGLRGLLANMMKRTKELERFDKDGKGWLRYTGNNEFKRSESDVKATGELSLRASFEGVAEKQNLKIIKRFHQTAPDFIIEKDGKKIGVELKFLPNTTSLEMALGQLLYARTHHNLQDVWLVMPKSTEPTPEYWLRLFKSEDVKIFILENNELQQLE